MRNLSYIILLGLLLVPGCSSRYYTPERPIEKYYGRFNVPLPSTLKNFNICNHHACTRQAEVGVTTEQWQQIVNVFTPVAPSADSERGQIAAAIGLMEQLMGPQANTFADQACDNFKEPLESFQLDCISEATNTTTYLRLLEQEELLRWHRVSYPARRTVLAFFIPHSSAVVRQLDSGELYAVDSWFYANGENAVIVPLELWRQNYYPGPCSPI